MKFSIYFLLLVVFLVQSCTSDPIELNSTCDATNEYLDSIYNNLGQMHNDGLDDVLEYLVNDYTGTLYTIPIEDLNEIVTDLIAGYCINIDLTDFYINDSILVDPNASLGDISSNLVFNVSEDLSEAADEVKYVLYNSSGANIHDDLNDLYDIWLPEISDCTERIAFTAMVSVAKSSITYWYQNYSNWAQLGEPDLINSAEFRGDPWRDAAWADAVGAGVGAIRGGLIGLAGGTVAIPFIGTAVGGAAGVMVGMISHSIGGSAASGLNSAAQWLIGW